MSTRTFGEFWKDAVALEGSITPSIFLHIAAIGAFAAAVVEAAHFAAENYDVRIGIEIAPYEFAGAVLGMLLVLRTNSGYDRWWEARKLWGGIVNQSRNLAVGAIVYGPKDDAWRMRFVQWASVFPFVAQASLRGEPAPSEVAKLVGPEAARQIEAAQHRPLYVAAVLAQQLRQATDDMEMDRFAFLQVDSQRAMLIDHIGGCERIAKTPLPRLYAIKIRQFLLVFFATLPFALLEKLGSDWLIPFVTMMTAFPVISLDQIGIELQSPFARTSLGHLPLDDIAVTIEKNLAAAQAYNPVIGKDAVRNAV
jgi:putative membrane protein